MKHVLHSTTCKQKYKAQSGDVQTHLHRESFVPSLRKHFFSPNSRFVVHKEFLSESQIVNQDVYIGILQRLLEGIRRRRPRCGQQGSGSSYTTMRSLIQHYPPKNFSHHIKSLCCRLHRNLQICYLTIFFLFTRLKRALKGHRHADTQTAMTIQLCNILESNFQDCFQDLQKRWKQQIDAG